MSCRHGCDPCAGWPTHGYYYGPLRDPDPVDDERFEERRWRRPRTADPGRAEVLEARLDELQAELRRVEAALAADARRRVEPGARAGSGWRRRVARPVPGGSG